MLRLDPNNRLHRSGRSLRNRPLKSTNRECATQHLTIDDEVRGRIDTRPHRRIAFLQNGRLNRGIGKTAIEALLIEFKFSGKLAHRLQIAPRCPPPINTVTNKEPIVHLPKLPLISSTPPSDCRQKRRGMNLGQRKIPKNQANLARLDELFF